MDLKIKTATIRYQRGANTHRGSVTVKGLMKETFGPYVILTYDEKTRRIELRATDKLEGDAREYQPYTNAQFPWKIDGLKTMPPSGGIDLTAVRDEGRNVFWAILPEKLPEPIARERKNPPRRRRIAAEGEVKSLSEQRKEVDASKSLRDQAINARADLVTAVGKLNGVIYAVDKETGKEVQIVPSTIRIVAKVPVVKLEEVEL